MGITSKAKALQTLADRAEQLYAQLMDVRERLARMEEDIEQSSDRVVAIEHELEEQRVILDALAEDAGLDIEQRLAEASITDAETGGSVEGEGDGESASTESESADASDDGVTAGESTDATAGDE